MNPKEFPWDESQQVTVKNPTSDDFRFKAHNKEYMVRAGQTVKMPGFIAWLFVYNMACKMAQEAGDFIHWNEEGFRQTYYEKVYVGADNIVQEVKEQSGLESDFEEAEDVTGSQDPSEHQPVRRRRRTSSAQ